MSSKIIKELHLIINYRNWSSIRGTTVISIEERVKQGFRGIDDLSKVILSLEVVEQLVFNQLQFTGSCRSEISIVHKKKPYETLSAGDFFPEYTWSGYIAKEDSGRAIEEGYRLSERGSKPDIPLRSVRILDSSDLELTMSRAAKKLADMYCDSEAADKEIEQHNKRAEKLSEIHDSLETIQKVRREDEWSQERVQAAALNQLEKFCYHIVNSYLGSNADLSTEAELEFGKDLSFLMEGLEMFDGVLPSAVTETLRETAVPREKDPCGYFINDEIADTLSAFMGWARKYCESESMEEAERLRAVVDVVQSRGLCESYGVKTGLPGWFDSFAELADFALKIVQPTRKVSDWFIVRKLREQAEKAKLSRGFIPAYVVDYFVEIVEPEELYVWDGSSTTAEDVGAVRDNIVELLEAYKAWGRGYCGLSVSGDFDCAPEEFERVRELKAGLDKLLEESSPVSAEWLSSQTGVNAEYAVKGADRT